MKMSDEKNVIHNIRIVPLEHPTACEVYIDGDKLEHCAGYAISHFPDKLPEATIYLNNNAEIEENGTVRYKINENALGAAFEAIGEIIHDTADVDKMVHIIG